MKRIVIDPNNLDEEDKPISPQKTNEILDGWLDEISHKYNYSTEEDIHKSLAEKAKVLFGGDINNYLKMYDRDLQDLIRSNNGGEKKEKT